MSLVITGVDPTIEHNIRVSVEGLHERAEWEALAEQEIAQALQPFGYYSPIIQITLPSEERLSTVTINITLGDPVQVTAVHFALSGEGKENTAFYSLISRFTLHSGDVLNHEKYEEGKKALLTPLIDAGYLNAAFTEHRVEVNVTDNTAAIYLTLNTGAAYYFGPVHYEKTVLSPAFLDRYLPFAPGEVYAPEKILMLQNRLSTSDYFSVANVKPQIEEQNTSVPIVVDLEDAKPNQYLFGLGYGTDTGIRGRAAWLRRRVNSRGHRFLAEARLSEIYTKLEADYIIPGKHPETDTIKIRGGYFEDQFNEQPTRIHEATWMEDRQLGKWQRRLSFGIVNETFPAFITYESVDARYILPSVTFIQTIRDNPVSPTRGRRIEINLRGSVDTLFSNTSFAQADIHTKWLHSYSDTLRLLARLELGASWPNDVEKIPLSQRFYTGGDLTLRGYAYRSLPLLIDQHGIAHPAGGTYLAVGSIEIVKTIKKPLGISAFIDAGNAFRETGNEMAAGPGLGVEWRTPFGPLKIAVAKPLTENSHTYRLHVIFGPEI